MEKFHKYAAERRYVGFEFISAYLAGGGTITSATAAVYPTGLTLDGAVVIDGDTVKQMIDGGTQAQAYIVTLHAVLANGEEYEESVEVFIT